MPVAYHNGRRSDVWVMDSFAGGQGTMPRLHKAHRAGAIYAKIERFDERRSAVARRCRGRPP